MNSESDRQKEVHKELAKPIYTKALKDLEESQRILEETKAKKAEEEKIQRRENLKDSARPALAAKRKSDSEKQERERLKVLEKNSLEELRALDNCQKKLLIEGAKRERHSRGVPTNSSGSEPEGKEMVHTLESKTLELRLNGIEKIGKTWARFSLLNSLEIGRMNQVSEICECPPGAWNIPVYEDGQGISVASVPPPISWIKEFGENYDDKDFFSACGFRPLQSSDDSHLFSDPSFALAGFLGRNLPVCGDYYFNDPTEEGRRIFEESKMSDRLFESLVEHGLLDSDHFYEEYHGQKRGFFIPPHLDVPEENSLVDDPESLDDDDGRRIWISSLHPEDLCALRSRVQHVVLEAFQAGREFERNIRREKTKGELASRTLLNRRGGTGKPHLLMIEQAIGEIIKGGKPLAEITPKSLEKYILEECGKPEWKSILENVGEKQSKPRMNCLKNGLANYRKRLKKTPAATEGQSSGTKLRGPKSSKSQKKPINSA